MEWHEFLGSQVLESSWRSDPWRWRKTRSRHCLLSEGVVQGAEELVGASRRPISAAHHTDAPLGLQHWQGCLGS